MSPYENGCNTTVYLCLARLICVPCITVAGKYMFEWKRLGQNACAHCGDVFWHHIYSQVLWHHVYSWSGIKYRRFTACHPYHWEGWDWYTLCLYWLLKFYTDSFSVKYCFPSRSSFYKNNIHRIYNNWILHTHVTTNLQSNRDLQYDESFFNKVQEKKKKKLNLVNIWLDLINLHIYHLSSDYVGRRGKGQYSFNVSKSNEGSRNLSINNANTFQREHINCCCITAVVVQHIS